MNRLDPTKTSFNWPNARQCLDASGLAYHESLQTLPAGTQLIKSPKTDAQAIIIAQDDCLIVAFRGSQAPEDFIQDAKFEMVPLGHWPTQGKVHLGFHEDWDSIDVRVLSALDRATLGQPAKPIFVTGHSLGGALAILAVRAFCRADFKVAGVYTFGQPRVGNAAFVRWYETRLGTFSHKLGEITYRIVNENDLVPRVPPWWNGYRHVGQEIFLCAPNGVLTNPHWWETWESDSVGFLRAMLKHTDVLAGDHYLEAYQKRIQLL